ncbi:MAG: extracellular solute-binding protein [Candidatus Omnitrophica bacterium]|nr:extracellular solute-binding protein [Candidatus Omnitrophota bacterium]
MKRNIVLIFLLILAVCITGCGKPAAKKDEVVVWHWMTDRDKALQTLAEKYQEKTGVTISLELYAPSNIYSQKIISAAQARVLPDIFGILDEKEILGEFIKSGNVANLTEAFQANNAVWKKSLFPRALAASQFEDGNFYDVIPGIYGVPLDVTNIQMLYNKKLLEKAGIKNPPGTFKEFLGAIAALRRVGISGMVSGWGEPWLINCFASNYAFNIVGEEKIMATYRGEVSYTDSDWLKVLGVFSTLHKKQALMEGIATKGNKYAEQDFALERAAFAFNGSWCVNVYNNMNAELEYGVMLPPAISKNFPMKIWGGAGSSFVVNDKSPNKDKAVAFLKWLTAKEQQAYLAKETHNLPSNRQALDAIPEILSEFAEAMDSTTHPTIWELNEDALVIEAFDRGIQSIIIGEKSPKKVAREVQAIKERQMKKKKR